jgi:hypothetical protein
VTTNWISLEDEAFAIWAARTSDIRRFADIVLEAGEFCDVFRLVTVAADGSDVRPFDDRAFLQARPSPFELPYEDAPSGRWLATSARLAWWDDGQLRERDVSWVGALLERLHPGVGADFAKHWMSWTAPLEVWGTRDFVHITLRTDAWFPRTLTLDTVEASIGLPRPMHDNLAAARVHTPRLNRFLGTLRQAADGWELLEPEGIGKLYHDMTDAGGVLLP